MESIKILSGILDALVDVWPPEHVLCSTCVGLPVVLKGIGGVQKISPEERGYRVGGNLSTLN